jgi:hypothetical protein
VTQPLRPEPLLTTLVEHEVAFIVVGGYAVAAHGFVRATKDIDICPDPDPENLRLLADALDALEAEPIGLDDFAAGEFDLKPDLEGLQYGGNWTLHTKHGRLDVLQHIQGLGTDGGGWRELAPHAVARQFLGHDCLFCSYEDLLKMKRAADRPQDHVDITSLKAARGEA